MSKYKYINQGHIKDNINKPATKDKGDYAMKNDYGTRFLAKDIEVSNNTHETLLNNNDIIIGASGCGKTTSYVYGNIAGMYGSYIIADTKGNLAAKFSPMLKANGYDVKVLDFVNIENSIGYNPMDNITRYSDSSYNERDVIALAELLSPVKSLRDPYWEDSAKNLLCALIALVLETEAPENQNLSTVGKYASDLGFLIHDKQGKAINNAMRRLHNTFVAARERNPQSLAWRKYSRFTDLQESEKTWTCIINCLQKAMTVFDGSAFDKMFTNKDKIDLSKPGRDRCAYFVNVSDSDRSNDPIANLFYSQVFQALISQADNNKTCRLDIPVRFVLDDFATNIYIGNFDTLISVIRSREISVSIILQSITQLDALYGSERARTIVNNCDHLLFYGNRDFQTIRFISDFTNQPLEKVINMPLDKMYILTRGQKPIYADRLAPDVMVFEGETDKFDEMDESNVTDEPEMPDMSVFRSIPKPSNNKANNTNIVIKNIPRSLVSTYGPANRRICKLSFAYKKEGDTVIYALLRLPAYRVKLEKGTYSFDLGKPETDYICNISDSQDKVNLTAKEINLIYRRSRVWYITYIKNRSSAITEPKS